MGTPSAIDREYATTAVRERRSTRVGCKRQDILIVLVRCLRAVNCLSLLKATKERARPIWAFSADFDKTGVLSEWFEFYRAVG
jgi:hypothetical protein